MHTGARTTATTSARRALALALLTLLAATVLACGGGDEDPTPARQQDTDDSGGDTDAVEVALEPVGSTGEDPFTESVAIGEVTEFPDAVAATIDATLAGATTDEGTGGLVAEGSTPGLYGGSGDAGTCDVAALEEFLADPDNAAQAEAFATVLGIDVTEIRATLATFTPALLTLDTLVTNHGFRDGEAQPFAAVLQAGTAVLVDPLGTPRVKCGCGNPLAAPPAAVDLDSTTGDAWDGFDAGTTATVTPSPQELDSLTLTDTTTGDTFQQPVGPTTTTTSTTSSTTTTTAPAGPDAGAAGFVGTWTGTIVGASQSFRADIVLREEGGQLVGTVEHPDLPCSGTLESLSVTGDVALFSNVYGPESNCIQGGTHRFTLLGPDQMLYEWLAPSSSRIDSGTLQRVG